jgi:hypothetical protein
MALAGKIEQKSLPSHVIAGARAGKPYHGLTRIERIKNRQNYRKSIKFSIRANQRDQWNP